MDLARLKGLGVALATPFKAAPGDAPTRFRRGRAWTCPPSAPWWRDRRRPGTDFLVVLGSTGEAATVTDERAGRSSWRRPSRRPQGVPGHRRRRATTRRPRPSSSPPARRARAPTGILVVTPYYNKPQPAGLEAHFRAVAAAAPGLPIIVYNVPGRTGLNLLPKDLAQALGHPRGGRASRSPRATSRRSARSSGPCPRASSSSRATTPWPCPRSRWAAHGLISVLGNLLPAETKALVDAALAGQARRGRASSTRGSCRSSTPSFSRAIPRPSRRPWPSPATAPTRCGFPSRPPPRRRGPGSPSSCPASGWAQGSRMTERSRPRRNCAPGGGLQAFYSRPWRPSSPTPSCQPRARRSSTPSSRERSARPRAQRTAPGRPSLGQARDTGGLPVHGRGRGPGLAGRRRREVGLSAAAFRRRRRRAGRAGRQLGPQGSPHRERRRHHAAGLRQRGRLDRRGHDGRQPRPRRLLRPGRRARAPLGRRPGGGRPRAGGSASRRRRGRVLHRRALRPLRGRSRPLPGGARERNGHHRLDDDIRSGQGRASSAASCPRARSSCPARAPPAASTRARARHLALRALHRQIPRRQDRRRHRPRGGAR